VRLTGVSAVKLPDALPAPVPCEHTSDQATYTSWSGLEVTLTMSVTGSVAVPLATQVA
jgi:hypothetical protein